MRGMNSVFGLKIQVSVGDTVITGLAVSLDLLTRERESRDPAQGRQRNGLKCQALLH